jgi:hypothetical protein
MSVVLGMRRNGGGSFTAAGVARARAEFDRPVSPSGNGDVGGQLARQLPVRPAIVRNPIFVRYMKARTKFFDAIVMEASAQPGQVVLVGAGYDDRALRFRAPGVQFVEVDHPATQQDKIRRLKALGIDADEVEYVPIDLESEAIDSVLGPAPVRSGRRLLSVRRSSPIWRRNGPQRCYEAWLRAPEATSRSRSMYRSFPYGCLGVWPSPF